MNALRTACLLFVTLASLVTGEVWLPLGNEAHTPYTLTGIARVVAGTSQVIAITQDGRLTGWGLNERREQRLPTSSSRFVRARSYWTRCAAVTAAGEVLLWGDLDNPAHCVPVGLDHVVDVGINSIGLIALKQDSSVVTWTDGRAGYTSIPIALPTIQQIAVGDSHYVALGVDGSVSCWGDNSEGQCDVPADLPACVAVAAGGKITVALTAAGEVRVWGTTIYGQITVPDGLGTVTAIAASWSQVLALRADGTVQTLGPGGAMVPSDLTGVTQIDASGFVNVALRADGSTTAWGAFYDYGGSSQIPVRPLESGIVPIAGNGEQLLFRTSTGALSSWRMFCDPPAALNPVTAAVGGGFGVAITGTDTVTTWGMVCPAVTDVPVALHATQVAAGYDHILVRQTSGMAAAWGWNTFGQCTIPGSLGPVLQVAAGGHFSAALRTDGAVRAWGNAPAGGPCDVPSDLPTVSAIAAGANFMVALTSTGTVRAWGFDYQDQASPPAGLDHVVAIATGDNHTLALRDNGEVAMWGMIDNDTVSFWPRPTGVTAIMAGGRYAWIRRAARLPVTVTVTSASIPYDGQPHGVETDITGHLKVGYYGWKPPVNLTFNGSTTYPTAVGTYAVVATVDTWGHSGTGSGTLTITGNAITFPAISPQTYGSQVVLGASSSAGLPISYSVLSGPGSLSGAVLTCHGTGTITVRASQSGSSTVPAATPVNVDITVDPAPLTITANDRTKVVGNADPTLTATFSGFVLGDNSSDLGGTLTLVRDPGEVIGSYAIHASGVTASTYAISFAPGTLTITAVPPPGGSGGNSGGGGGGGCGVGATALLLAAFLCRLSARRLRRD